MKNNKIDEIQRLELEFDQIREIIPEDLYDLLRYMKSIVKKAILYVVKIGDESVAYALFLEYVQFANMIELDYMYVKADYANDDIKADFINEILHDMPQYGYYHVVSYLSEEDADEARVLEKIGFEKQYSGYGALYSVNDIKEGVLVKRKNEIRQIVDKSIRYEDVISNMPSQFDTFKKKVYSQMSKVDFDKFDTQLTRFFVEKGEIQGFLALSQIEEGALFVESYLILKECKSTYAFPSMILSMLDDVSDVLPDDTKIIMQMIEGNYIDAMNKAFGKAQTMMPLDLWHREYK